MPKRKQSEETGTELSADVSALIETIKAESIAFRKEEQREDTGKRFREWITIALISCTLVAVCWQVAEMIRVYGPVRDQAIASQSLAVAAIKQAENTERSLIHSQRAWVLPTKIALAAEPKAGTSNAISIEFENIGHEPALKFNYILTPYIDDNRTGGYSEYLDSLITVCKSQEKIESGTIVFPGASGKISNPDNFTDIPAKFIDEDIEKGRSNIVVTGCFTYTTFGHTHHTAFCYFYQKDLTPFSSLKLCWNGSDAD
jgi:hypothetical protein